MTREKRTKVVTGHWRA